MVALTGKIVVAGVSGKGEEEDRIILIEDYEPVRPARLLRDPVSEPPPLPPGGTPVRRDHLAADDFGAADEDGLLMLAALETFTSLEPDYVAGDLLAAEASVTIIESGHDIFSGESHPPRRDPYHAAEGEPELLLNGYETFLALGEEATIEIVDPGRPFEEAKDAPRARSPAPTSLAERIAAAAGPSGRFFKALSGA